MRCGAIPAAPALQLPRGRRASLSGQGRRESCICQIHQGAAGRHAPSAPLRAAGAMVALGRDIHAADMRRTCQTAPA